MAGLGGPYDAVVPSANAILAAWHGLSAVTQLRIRRDFPAIITAIATSAIAHKAQRAVDGKGRLMATIEDYTWAYEAFATGLGRAVSSTGFARHHPAGAGNRKNDRGTRGRNPEIRKEKSRKPHPDFSLPADSVRATHRQIMTALALPRRTGSVNASRRRLRPA